MKYPLTEWYVPYGGRSKVYISGPMSGIEDHNFPAFDAARETLVAMGFSVCSPADTSRVLQAAGMSQHADFLRFDFARVLEADKLVVLDGWQRSKGAVAELLVANYIGLLAFEFETYTYPFGRRIQPSEIMAASVQQFLSYSPFGVMADA